MAEGLLAGERPTPSNAIAIAAAVGGIVSAFASGTLGYEHAKGAWSAATGGTAGLDDYIDVATALWDALPVAAAVAVVVGLLAAGQVPTVAFLRYGAGLVGILALGAGSQLDPDHLVVFQQTVNSGASDSVGLLQLWFAAYGPLAGWLAVISGVGVGYAAGTWFVNSQSEG